MIQPHDKTPTKFAGLKPDSHDFEERFFGWPKSEQVKYIEYFERDTIRFNCWLGIGLGIAIGSVLTIILVLILK